MLKRPTNSRVRLNLALQLSANGDMAGADEQIREGLKAPIQLPSLRTEQIKILREFGRSAEAVDAAKAFHEDSPDRADAAYEYGLSLLIDNQPDAAIPLLRNAAAEHPDNKYYRLHYGIALLRSGQAAEADAEFRATAALDSDYPAELNQSSRRSANDPDARPPLLRLALWYSEAACRMVQEPSAEFRDTHAMILARNGQFSEAADEATRAAEQVRQGGDAYHADRIAARAARYRAGKTALPE
jgi:Flp pilus assembly protein TadD